MKEPSSSVKFGFGDAYVADHQLNRFRMVVLVLLDSVADIHRFVGVDMLEVWRHIKRDCRYHTACTVVLKFELDMLKVLAHEFGSAEVKDVARTEYGFLVAWSEWVKLL